ncbi:gluconate 2-dehydrogenase subunit 3 family protein [Ningiella sp. W23]|uniref:gluconate 2-dehydrogenase subunit 3 family protein n=1 Tax=Ningiella sp. W23 TaxID=3023715 RepID=UPI003757E29D
MQRRDILKLAASVTGAAILAPLSSSMLYASVKNTSGRILLGSETREAPAFFSPDSFEQLRQIMDVILPRTDTPSASDVNTHWIFDNMFTRVFKPDYRNAFLKKFAQLEGYLNKQNFADSDSSTQLSIIQAIEARSEEKRDEVYSAYIDIKQQTISYYLTTEQIAENHLNYLPIPVQYIPCISVKELGGKAWAE